MARAASVKRTAHACKSQKVPPLSAHIRIEWSGMPGMWSLQFCGTVVEMEIEVEIEIESRAQRLPVVSEVRCFAKHCAGNRYVNAYSVDCSEEAGSKPRCARHGCVDASHQAKQNKSNHFVVSYPPACPESGTNVCQLKFDSCRRAAGS